MARLNWRTDRPWQVLKRGKAVTETWLSQQLRPYGLRPKTIWIGEDSAKGYLEEDFGEIFRRYVPRSTMLKFVEEEEAANRQKAAQPRAEPNAERPRGSKSA